MNRLFDNILTEKMITRVFATSTILGGVSGVVHGFQSCVHDRSVAKLTEYGMCAGVYGAAVGMFAPFVLVPLIPVSISACLYTGGLSVR